jgi:predicted nuclease with TOPRIM domain
MLTEQLQKQIADEADEYGFVVPYNNSKSFYIEDKVKGYKAGANAYAPWKVMYDEAKRDFERVQKSAIHYANRKDEVEKERDELKERSDKMAKEHSDLNLALAAMLNGYQNLSMYQKGWFTVPKDLIDSYTKMVLEYDTNEIEQEPTRLTPEQIADRKTAIEWYRNPEGKKEGENE